MGKDRGQGTAWLMGPGWATANCLAGTFSAVRRSGWERWGELTEGLAGHAEGAGV